MKNAKNRQTTPIIRNESYERTATEAASHTGQLGHQQFIDPQCCPVLHFYPMCTILVGVSICTADADENDLDISSPDSFSFCSTSSQSICADSRPWHETRRPSMSL